MLRNLIGAAGKIAAIGYDDSADVSEAIDRAEQELFAVSERRVESGFAPLKTLLHSAYDRLDYLHQHKGEISGIRTGFADLDALTSGLQKSDLVVARRPAQHRQDQPRAQLRRARRGAARARRSASSASR